MVLTMRSEDKKVVEKFDNDSLNCLWMVCLLLFLILLYCTTNRPSAVEEEALIATEHADSARIKIHPRPRFLYPACLY